MFVIRVRDDSVDDRRKIVAVQSRSGGSIPRSARTAPATPRGTRNIFTDRATSIRCTAVSAAAKRTRSSQT
jgi:hypothetical protein